MLEGGVEDARAALRFLKERFPGAPIVVVGFSWGGCVMWPALQEPIADNAVISGAAAIAGSARGGADLEAKGLGSRAGVAAFCKKGGAVLFLHGSRDKNVALQVAEYLFGAAETDLKRLVQILGAKHMLDSVREVAFEELSNWARCVLRPRGHTGALTGVEARGKPRGDARLKPSRRRLSRVAVEPGHPLQGLVGYSE